MAKKFDPQITPGPWVTYQDDPNSEYELITIKGGKGGSVCSFGEDVEYYCSPGCEPNEVDLKAILAVPEMLEVVNAARRFIDSFEEKFIVFEHLEGGLAILQLSEAIQALDEKHGVES